MSMNPEVKAKWVAALRSGAYQQGRTCLRDVNNGFCCLGVLCDILHPGEWHPNGSDRSWGFRRDVITGYPPYEMKDETGLDWDGEVTIGGKTMDLASHNDDGRTFAEIADAIEQQL